MVSTYLRTCSFLPSITPRHPHPHPHTHTHTHRSVQTALCPCLKIPRSFLFLYLSTGCSLCFVSCFSYSPSSRVFGSRDPVIFCFPRRWLFANHMNQAWELKWQQSRAFKTRFDLRKVYRISSGIFENQPAVLLAWPCNKPFFAPNSDMLVWPHCVSNTGSCIQ